METNLNASTTGSDAGWQPQQTSKLEETRHKAQEAASEAQHKLASQLRSSADNGRSRAADMLGSMAQALTQSAQQLRQENPDAQGQYVEKAGEQLRRASDYLRNTNTDELIRTTESFARRQPALFLGGAFALGVLAARFLKSSQQAEYQSQREHALTRWNEAGTPSQSWSPERQASIPEFREPGTSGGSWQNTGSGIGGSR